MKLYAICYMLHVICYMLYVICFHTSRCPSICVTGTVWEVVAFSITVHFKIAPGSPPLIGASLPLPLGHRPSAPIFTFILLSSPTWPMHLKRYRNVHEKEHKDGDSGGSEQIQQVILRFSRLRLRNSQTPPNAAHRCTSASCVCKRTWNTSVDICIPEYRD